MQIYLVKVKSNNVHILQNYSNTLCDMCTYMVQVYSTSSRKIAYFISFIVLFSHDRVSSIADNFPNFHELFVLDALHPSCPSWLINRNFCEIIPLN